MAKTSCGPETPLHLLPSPSQSRSTRYPLDQRLRRAGFRIEWRRRGQEPVWSLNGVEYTQSEALETLKAMET